MQMIQYLNDFLNDFKTLYPEFNTIKTSVGFTPGLLDIRSMNDLPLILIEEIEYNNDTNSVIQNIGTLNFSFMYLNQITYDNGYQILEDEFVVKFNNYLKTNCNDTNIVSIAYDTDDDNRYAVTYKLSSNIELS